MEQRFYDYLCTEQEPWYDCHVFFHTQEIRVRWCTDISRSDTPPFRENIIPLLSIEGNALKVYNVS